MIVWNSTAQTIDRDPATGAEVIVAPEDAVQRKADRDAIVEQALVWLRADSDQAEQRAQQIAAAVAAIDTQIQHVQAYTFAGTTVAQINTSLNGALKPQLIGMLKRQRAIGVMLQELQVARDRHGDALVWLGRYLTT